MTGTGHTATLLGTAMLGILLTLTPPAARGQDVSPLVPTGQFGLMGAVRGEIVRLSIANVNLAPPDPCRVTLALVDSHGNVLVRPDGTPLRREVLLEAGQSASLQFNAGAILDRGEARLNFRPVVLGQPFDPSAPPDPCVPSLEIIDGTTGQTRLLIPGTARLYSGNHNETLVADE